MSGFDEPEQAPRLLGTVTVLLTGAACALDVVTFFAFNGVFASTMTGNFVLLGLNAGLGTWSMAIEEVCAVTGYVLGLGLCALGCGRLMRRWPWRSPVTAALAVELLILVVLGVVWYARDTPAAGTARAALLVVGSALAMGVQAAAFRYVGPAGTPTNFLTGTVTNWVASLSDPNVRAWDTNGLLRIAAGILGAVAGAMLQDSLPAYSILLPIALVAPCLVLMMLVTRANHGGLATGGPSVPLAAAADAG